jgi:hypothetical protein
MVLTNKQHYDELLDLSIETINSIMYELDGTLYSVVLTTSLDTLYNNMMTMTVDGQV